ncbi:hypothetical protein SALBM217S_09854 [Streptomyces griseoloalbus]
MTRMTPSGDASALEWFKSSYSSNDGPECVEVAAARSTVHVRDSKDFSPGPRSASPPPPGRTSSRYASGG